MVDTSDDTAYGDKEGKRRITPEHIWIGTSVEDQTIRDDCLKAGAPYLHKQGTHRYPGHDRELDGRTWDQYPAVTRNPLGIIYLTSRYKGAIIMAWAKVKE